MCQKNQEILVQMLSAELWKIDWNLTRLAQPFVTKNIIKLTKLDNFERKFSPTIFISHTDTHSAT